jgi:hypothetical protein
MNSKAFDSSHPPTSNSTGTDCTTGTSTSTLVLVVALAGGIGEILILCTGSSVLVVLGARSF